MTIDNSIYISYMSNS